MKIADARREVILTGQLRSWAGFLVYSVFSSLAAALVLSVLTLLLAKLY